MITRTQICMMFGCTDLIIGVSRAKNCKEPSGDVRFYVATEKPCKNTEKQDFQTENFAEENFRESRNEMLGIV